MTTGYYRFLLMPQYNSLSMYKSKLQAYSDQLERAQAMIKGEKGLDTEYLSVSKNIDIVTNSILPYVDQEQLIMIIGQFLESSGLGYDNISFSRPTNLRLGDLDVDVTTAGIRFTGSYQSLTDFLKEIREYPRKIIVKDLSINGSDNEKINGYLNLDFYKLSNEANHRAPLITWDFSEAFIKENPFLMDSFIKDYFSDSNNGTDNNNDRINRSNIKISFGNNKTLLDGFEKSDYKVITSHFDILANVANSNNSKEDKYSLRLEYYHRNTDQPKSVHLLLEDQGLNIDYPPSKIGLWVHAIETSNHEIKLWLRDNQSKIHIVSLVDRIDWTGWKYVDTSPALDMASYPTSIERLVIEMPKNERGSSVLLFDGLECVISTEEVALFNSSTIIKETSKYIYYLVQPGDTLFKISEKFYGDRNKYSTIMNLNGIKDVRELFSGKVIVIPKEP